MTIQEQIQGLRKTASSPSLNLSDSALEEIRQSADSLERLRAENEELRSKLETAEAIVHTIGRVHGNVNKA